MRAVTTAILAATVIGLGVVAGAGAPEGAYIAASAEAPKIEGAARNLTACNAESSRPQPGRCAKEGRAMIVRASAAYARVHAAAPVPNRACTRDLWRPTQEGVYGALANAGASVANKRKVSRWLATAGELQVFADQRKAYCTRRGRR